MSIDHGKLLAMANGVKQHITWRENGVGRAPSLAEMREWESTFRALARPAEAVDWSAVADSETGWDAFLRCNSDDAAQGAVAPYRNEFTNGECADKLEDYLDAATKHDPKYWPHGINRYVERAIHVLRHPPIQRPLADSEMSPYRGHNGRGGDGDRRVCYTHPQAAPALMSSQDDWTVLDCPHCGKCVTYSKKAASSKDAYRDLTQEVESLRERLGQAAPAQGCGLTLPDSRLDAALDLLCGLTGEHRQRITDDARMDHLCDTARQIAALAAPAQGDGCWPATKEEMEAYWEAYSAHRVHGEGEAIRAGLAAYQALRAAAPSQEGE